MNWFRMYSEFATDPKVQMLPEHMQRRLVMLFCIRCNVAEALHDDEIAFQLRISNDDWGATKALFIEKGFINSDNEIINWDKRQYRSDSSTERSRRHRNTAKQSMQQPCNVAATPPDTEQIQNRTDIDKKENAAQGDGNFLLPVWIEPVVWDDFMQTRKRLKAVNSDRAKQSILNELERLRERGHDPNAVILTSIRSSWKDVYEPKKTNGVSYGNGKNGYHKPSAHDNFVAGVANWLAAQPDA